MANANAAFGLRRARSVAHSNSAANEYAHPSSDGTALFIGDSVVTNGTSTSGLSGISDGTPTVIASGSTTTTAIRGFVEGVRPTLTNLTLQYGAASTAYALWVCDDPYVTVDVQCSGTNAIGDVSGNIGIVAAAGSTVTGLSGYQADESNLGSTNVLRIIRVAPVTGNAVGANAVLECTINAHELKSTSGT